MWWLVLIIVVLIFLIAISYLIYRDELALHVAKAKINKQTKELNELYEEIKKITY